LSRAQALPAFIGPAGGIGGAGLPNAPLRDGVPRPDPPAMSVDAARKLAPNARLY
jgi:hypothetical protein